MSFPILTVAAALPAVGAVLTAALPPATNTRSRDRNKVVPLLFSLGTLVLACVVAARYQPHGARYQMTENHSWIPQFGINYSLGVDGLGVVLILLTGVLVPFVMLASWHDADPVVDDSGTFERNRRTQGFFALILAVEAMVVIAFEATDVFLFYVFFEAMLIPMYFLIGGFGDRTKGEDARQRSYAAVKFLLYNLLGGLVMLAAVIGLYTITHTFSLVSITTALQNGSLHFSSTAENALFLGFMFAFAVKAPLWPLHTWLPNAMGEATPGVAVLITAVVDKVGTFAMLRFCLQLFPQASKTFAPAILVLSVIGILYGALLAVGQKDIKRLVAYASISHFGFIILGIFALTSQGQSGAELYMVNHGVSTAAWLLVAGFLMSRRGSRLIADYGGVQKVAPIMAGTFLVGGLAILSLPGLGPFVSEFLVLVGTFERYPALGIVATAGIVLAALYVLVLYQRTMTGPVKPGNEGVGDLKARELVVVAPLIALLLVLGVYPKPIADIVNPSVNQTLSQMGQSDPTPHLTSAHSNAATTTTGGGQ
ncbi:NADH-quinone oxidoreductase subunit M [Streptacidiphilus melanogenes]|uniref:NADH-quinone oxidoreductase subunit M n=1 Tax=Streptacidiphilus melanogenes TaxID=411235 RepID=UPI0005AAD204|nr:NADH-quinone oxidoreductase subunit M [Streptacidiphilus melanogenes]